MNKIIHSFLYIGKLEVESKEVKNHLLHSSLDSLLEKAANKIDRPV
ncbi:TPA: hypothetical protein RG647_RS02275 [Providencia rettgeri]|nr:hypothetical protein [Providencia rettgeri]